MTNELKKQPDKPTGSFQNMWEDEHRSSLTTWVLYAWSLADTLRRNKPETMKFLNHIANRFINDPTMMDEIMNSMHPGWQDFANNGKLDSDEHAEEAAKICGLFDMLDSRTAKHYWISDTVFDKLDLLRVKKREVPGYGLQYDWRVFNHIPEGKKTFIFPDGRLIRFLVDKKFIQFICAEFQNMDKKNNHAYAKWVIFFVDREDGRQGELFPQDVGMGKS